MSDRTIDQAMAMEIAPELRARVEQLHRKPAPS